MKWEACRSLSIFDYVLVWWCFFFLDRVSAEFQKMMNSYWSADNCSTSRLDISWRRMLGTGLHMFETWNVSLEEKKKMQRYLSMSTILWNAISVPRLSPYWTWSWRSSSGVGMGTETKRYCREVYWAKHAYGFTAKEFNCYFALDCCCKPKDCHSVLDVTYFYSSVVKIAVKLLFSLVLY